MKKLDKIIWKNWDSVEKKIQKEILWLENAIPCFLKKETTTPKGCRECFKRKIAILIVSGQIRATEFTKTKGLDDFWKVKKTFYKKKEGKRKPKQHGGQWHSEKMNKIENHFLSRGYDVVREPDVHGGKADLGIYKKRKLDLIIEVGTTSFFKLWLNLMAVKNCIYLIVPDDNSLIEFMPTKIGSASQKKHVKAMAYQVINLKHI